jgi:hypothetical protein
MYDIASVPYEQSRMVINCFVRGGETEIKQKERNTLYTSHSGKIKGKETKMEIEGNRYEQNITPATGWIPPEVKCKKKPVIPVRLYDTPRFDEVIRDEVLRKRGFHAVVLLIPLTRYTKERQKFFEQVCEAFDKDLSSYLIVIFTKNENQGSVDEIRKSIQDNCASHSHVHKLIEAAGSKCLSFDPNGNKDEMILKFTDKLDGVVDHTHYEKINLQKIYLGRIGLLQKILKW